MALRELYIGQRQKVISGMNVEKRINATMEE